MKLDHVQLDRPVHVESISQSDTRLYGVWLNVVRIAWIVLVLFLLGFLLSVFRRILLSYINPVAARCAR
jgi:hypothetical protein